MIILGKNGYRSDKGKTKAADVMQTQDKQKIALCNNFGLDNPIQCNNASITDK